MLTNYFSSKIGQQNFLLHNAIAKETLYLAALRADRIQKDLKCQMMVMNLLMIGLDNVLLQATFIDNIN